MNAEPRQFSVEEQLHHLDEAVALSRVGGDVELLREVVGLFLDDYPQSLDLIRDAVARGDQAGLERHAHSLKGSVSTFGAAGSLRCRHGTRETRSHRRSGSRGRRLRASGTCHDRAAPGVVGAAGEVGRTGPLADRREKPFCAASGALLRFFTGRPGRSRVVFHYLRSEDFLHHGVRRSQRAHWIRGCGIPRQQECLAAAAAEIAGAAVAVAARLRHPAFIAEALKRRRFFPDPAQRVFARVGEFEAGNHAGGVARQNAPGGIDQH